jgi:hypothetical protein
LVAPHGHGIEAVWLNFLREPLRLLGKLPMTSELFMLLSLSVHSEAWTFSHS